MGKFLSFNYENASSFVAAHELDYASELTKIMHEKIHQQTGAGSDFLGWVDLPENYDRDEFTRIQKAASKIQLDSDVLLVIGIGGSYLGARAAIEALNNHFYNLQDKATRKAPQIIFVGHHISSTYVQELVDYLEDKTFSINVISKSGTTTEPAIAFRIFKKLLIDFYLLLLYFAFNIRKEKNFKVVKG